VKDPTYSPIQTYDEYLINGESYVLNHIHQKNQDVYRETRSFTSVTYSLRNQITKHRTRIFHESRKTMRIIFLALLVWNGCTQVPQTERKTIPIIDKSGEIHIYRSSNPLELGNDYALYCMEHHHWETISVRYQPAPLAKLRYEEYIVRRHPKSS